MVVDRKSRRCTMLKKLAPLWVIYTLFVVFLADLVAVAVEEKETTSTKSICNDNDNHSEDGSCSNNDNDILLDPMVKQWIDELPTENSLYLNGAWMKPTSSSSASVKNGDGDMNNIISVVDPSTGQTIAKVNVASKNDVDAAVVAAREALDGWSIDTTLNERRRLVYKLLQLYNENAEQMAQLISHEMGAPIDFARDSQVTSGSYVMHQFLHEVGEEGSFESVYQLNDYEDTTIYHQPIGVVGLITPWNWPMNQIVLKVVPALLVGCTVILKPSEETPLSALLFGKLINEVGFPKGTFQLVNGYGPDHVGEWLASHPGIDMISFTGSTRGGKQVSLAAAPTLKRVSLEMGGKGANIIFDDLIEESGDMDDFTSAIERGVWDVMSNSGQSCDAPTRMLIPKEHWDLALKVAKDAALEIEVGSAHKEGEHIGPVVSKVQYERIQNYIRIGIDEGATLLVGGLGKPFSEDELQEGFYVKPTIFADCKPVMTIWKDEIFGPVLCMTSFNSEEEAILLANDSPYGLTHYAHTYDRGRRLRLAQKLQSGMVVMNSVSLASAAPFGGVKQSGNSREGGLWGLEDFCIVKSVSGLS